MNFASEILLTITLVLCGGYAGMVLMCQIAILPAARDLEPRSFAEVWRALDRYMDKLMPPYKGALLLFTLLSAVICFIQRHPVLACTCAVSLLLSVAGLVLTIRGQLPLNAELKTTGLPEDRIIAILEQTSAGFRTRFYLAGLSFLSLCIGVVFWSSI